MLEYKVKAQVPTVRDYIRIRLAAGLSRKTVAVATVGLKNSLFSVMVSCQDEAVGIGRVIGDGDCFFEVIDIAVLPEHQGKGIGRLVMDALMDCIHKHAPKSAYISLMADHRTPGFYEKFGFQRAEAPDTAGMFLRL